MAPITAREVAKLLLSVALSAILYRYWLITPVLTHLSPNQWRAIAIVVVVFFSCLWSLAKWNASTLVCGFVVGVVAGGTWTMLPIQHGSFVGAFKSNLESFGRDMILLTVSAMVGGYCGVRFFIRRSLGSDSNKKVAHSNDA